MMIAVRRIGEHASFCQNSWRPVKPLPRYGDLSIFQDGGRRHLGFLNLKFLAVRRVDRVELRHRAKFRGDR